MAQTTRQMDQAASVDLCREKRATQSSSRLVVQFGCHHPDDKSGALPRVTVTQSRWGHDFAIRCCVVLVARSPHESLHIVDAGVGT